MKHFALVISAVVLATFVFHVVASSPLKIVNGTDAEEGEFPYMVQIFTKDNVFQCGGSIIGEEWILTAAHCFVEADIGFIAYGTNELDDKKIRKIEVKKAIQHPNFNFGFTIKYDIGLIQTSEKIDFSEKSQPVKLVESGADDPVGAWGNLSGWGENYTYANIPQIRLQKIKLQLLSGEECVKIFNTVENGNVFLPEHHLCTDDYWNGQCVGDSGGPYVVNGAQIGIVSWSPRPCGSYPGVQTHISNPKYRDWIKQVTGI